MRRSDENKSVRNIYSAHNRIFVGASSLARRFRQLNPLSSNRKSQRFNSGDCPVAAKLVRQADRATEKKLRRQ